MNETITKKMVQEFFPKASVKEEKDTFKIHAEELKLEDLTEFHYTIGLSHFGTLKRSGKGITLTIKK
ncbi:hypothetical protein MT996_08960 [Ornithobacterium rhinotracheale]|uniref:hypothetical protein n=2 Tax=Ornithobacterium rhinotracheale TaxID=28251 RepID=UPI001FBB19A2|nr:hypothetical protein [Ornithobacterium rhinotracheale]UOH77336.1 hypothetical protein MT996_08960 [Ornithobacterium rhinotracheale]